MGAFRKIYGSSDKRHVTPEHTKLAAGGLVRDILQQLEKAGLVEKHPSGGRRVTQQGQRDLDRVAQQVRRKAK